MGFKENYARFSNWLESEKVIFVDKKEDFPAPVSGVITLEAGLTYFVTTDVDLAGSRLVAGANTVIIGGSSENCFLRSTGLSASTALLTSQYSLPMRNISFTHGTALALNGNTSSTTALDWFGVNFTNCATVGTIQNYSNFIMSDCALLSSANMTFDGTFGTVGFTQCLFSGIAGQTTLNFPSTLTITRRIRATYSSFVAFGGATAINVSTSAVVPVEGYILDTVNFSGGATYTAGVQYSDNKALFTNCKGIINSSEIGQMYFNNNATATTIAAINTFVKVAGTTTANAINQKFSHTANRLTYTGGLNRSFRVSVVASLSANNGNILTAAIAKNGTVLAESEMTATISANGRFENMKCQVLVELAPNDFVEVWVSNSAVINVTCSDLNLIIEALN